jgi:hypothetical protein
VLFVSGCCFLPVWIYWFGGFFVLFICFAVVGIEPRELHMLGKCSTPDLHLEILIFDISLMWYEGEIFLLTKHRHNFMY